MFTILHNVKNQTSHRLCFERLIACTITKMAEKIVRHFCRGKSARMATAEIVENFSPFCLS
jgi:hypothetical protein